MDSEHVLPRLRYLEQENRRWKGLTFSLAAAVCGFLVLGYAHASGTPEVVEAKRFVLKDSRGQERAVLEVDPAGSARLTFFRPDGSRALSLSDKAEAIPVR